MTTQTTTQTERYFITRPVHSKGYFFILEMDGQLYQSALTSAVDRQTAWNIARSQKLPVKFVGLDGTVKELGVVYSAEHVAKAAAAEKAAKPVDEPATEGFYQLNGAIYKVMKNRAGNRLYARKLVVVNGKGEWHYDKGTVYSLKQSNRLTPAQAKEFGDLHHFCLCCHRELTQPLSIERGVGPVCWGRLGF